MDIYSRGSGLFAADERSEGGRCRGDRRAGRGESGLPPAVKSALVRVEERHKTLADEVASWVEPSGAEASMRKGHGHPGGRGLERLSHVASRLVADPGRMKVSIGPNRRKRVMSICRAALVALVLLMVGCSTATGTVKLRFSREHNCPEDRIQLTELGGNAYRLVGCGHNEIFTCICSKRGAYGSCAEHTCVKSIKRQ